MRRDHILSISPDEHMGIIEDENDQDIAFERFENLEFKVGAPVGFEISLSNGKLIAVEVKLLTGDAPENSWEGPSYYFF